MAGVFLAFCTLISISIFDQRSAGVTVRPRNVQTQERSCAGCASSHILVYSGAG